MTQYTTTWPEHWNRYAVPFVVVMQNESQPPYILAAAGTLDNAIAKAKVIYAALDLPARLSIYSYNPQGYRTGRFVQWEDGINDNSWTNGQRTINEYAAYLLANQSAPNRTALGPFVIDGEYVFEIDLQGGVVTVYKDPNLDGTQQGDSTREGVAIQGESGSFAPIATIGARSVRNPDNNTQRFAWKHRYVPNGIPVDSLAWSANHGPVFPFNRAEYYPGVPTKLQVVDRREETPIMETLAPSYCVTLPPSKPLPGIAGYSSVYDGAEVYHPTPGVITFENPYFPDYTWRRHGDFTHVTNRPGEIMELNVNPPTINNPRPYNFEWNLDAPNEVQNGTIPNGFGDTCRWQYAGTVWEVIGGYYFHRYAVSMTLVNPNKTSPDIHLDISQSHEEQESLLNARYSMPDYRQDWVRDVVTQDEYGDLQGYPAGPFKPEDDTWQTGIEHVGNLTLGNYLVPGAYMALVYYPVLRVYTRYAFLSDEPGSTLQYTLGEPTYIQLSLFIYGPSWEPPTIDNTTPAETGHTYNTLAAPFAVAPAGTAEPNAGLPSAVFAGTLDDGSKVYGNWHEHYAQTPAPYERDPVPNGKVCIGYVTGEPMGPVQAPPEYNPVYLEEPILVNGPTTLHVWTGPISIAPAGAIGHLVHVDGNTGFPVPSAGNIYPIYDSPKSVTVP